MLIYNVKFQTKLTYDMICYDKERQEPFGYTSFKLSWLMIWFVIIGDFDHDSGLIMFQTKLTYDMICYKINEQDSSPGL